MSFTLPDLILTVLLAVGDPSKLPGVVDQLGN